MRTDPARVLVVDDDEAIASAIQLALGGAGYDVQVAADADAAAAIAEVHGSDLAVLDLRLPGPRDGTDLAVRLREGSDLPIIFLTAVDDLETRVTCFSVGADDYLAKPFSMAELLLRIHALLRRSGRLTSGVLRVSDLEVDEGRHVVLRAGLELELTPTEFRILATLARNPGLVLSKLQLLQGVWGYDAYDTNLVEVHVSSLRRKLEACGPRILHTVRGVGYVVRE